MQPEWYRTPERPVGVAALALLTAAAGAATILRAVWEPFRGLVDGSVIGASWLAPLTLKAPPEGIVGGLLGGAFVISGVGLWSLRPWAWWLAATIGAVGLILSLGSIPWMAVWAGLLIYLVVVHPAFSGVPKAARPAVA